MEKIGQKYVIPLRKGLMKVPVYLRSKKAVKLIRAYLKKHLKEDVKLGSTINEKIWANGPKNPPTKVEVVINSIEKDDKKFLQAEIFGMKPKERVKKVIVQKRKRLSDLLKRKIVKEETENKEQPTEDKKTSKTDAKPSKKVEEKPLKKEEEAKERKLLKKEEEEKAQKEKPPKDLHKKEKTAKKEVNEKVREEQLVKRKDKKQPIKK